MTTATDLANRLRQLETLYWYGSDWQPKLCRAAADFIDSQAARIAELDPLAKEVERLKIHKRAIVSVIGGVALERKEQIKEQQAVIDLLIADLAAARSELVALAGDSTVKMQPTD